jgi:hypothetical protein
MMHAVPEWLGYAYIGTSTVIASVYFLLPFALIRACKVMTPAQVVEFVQSQDHWRFINFCGFGHAVMGLVMGGAWVGFWHMTPYSAGFLFLADFGTMTVSVSSLVKLGRALWKG